MSDPLTSFRDPGGRLVRVGGRILRFVSQESAPEVLDFLASPLAQRFTSDGRIVASRVAAEDASTVNEGSLPLPETTAPGVVLEHDAVPFPSYPYEWTVEMLADAGRLTLDLAEELLPAGWGLKDATPYNVLFRGPKPVFVDLLSMEKRKPGDSTWLPFAQFQRTFILPLIAAKRHGVALSQTFTLKRDGITPESLYPFLGPLERCLPPYLGLVSLPTWLGRQEKRPPPAAESRTGEPEKARFVLGSLFRHLRRQLEKAATGHGVHSHWAGYMETFSYAAEAFAAKERFVADAIQSVKPLAVLDLGCNTGHFSRMAAQGGARVVAVDSDPAVVGALYTKAKSEALDVLPLAVDVSRPSPGLGWRNREHVSFIERASGGFDMVLALALVHHLLVTERIPLDEILTLLAQLSHDAVVVELVLPTDPMFLRLARGREHLHADLTQAAFEQACQGIYVIDRLAGPLQDTRWLYLLRKKAR